MCEQDYYLVKRKFFKNKYRKIHTTCICGAESQWLGVKKMLDAGMTSEEIKGAFNKIIRNAR